MSRGEIIHVLLITTAIASYVPENLKSVGGKTMLGVMSFVVTLVFIVFGHQLWDWWFITRETR